MKYVIIGYSVAAVNAIKSIRNLDNKSEILVITDEDRLYSRPLISYYVAGKVSEDKMSFVEPDFDTKYKLNVYYSTTVKSVDTKTKTIMLDNKKKINYDKLLITVGGKPIIPEIKGYNSEIKGIFTFTKLSDAKKLVRYIKENKIKQAVILGGGLIGMKAAEGLISKDIKLKIIDIADRLLANTFDKTASSYIEKKLTQQGCEFIPNNTIIEIISKNKNLCSVKLKDAKKIDTKLLIIAVGVRPNLDIIEKTTIKYNRGILVNNFMQTNFSDIYAAGDVAETKNFITEENSVLAIWPAAAYQGKVAGVNMVAKNKVSYDGLYPMNSVEILGVPSISFGITNPLKEDNFEIISKEEKDSYKKIVLKDNKIIGAIFVGDINRAGIYSLLIKQKVDVSQFKNQLLKEDFGLLVLPKDFRKNLVIGEGVEI